MKRLSRRAMRRTRDVAATGWSGCLISIERTGILLSSYCQKKRAADLNWAKEERGEVRRIRVREAECDV